MSAWRTGRDMGIVTSLIWMLVIWLLHERWMELD